MREHGLPVREGFLAGNTPSEGRGLDQVRQLQLLQIVSEMFAVVEGQGDGATEGLEADSTAVSSLLLLNINLLPFSQYWLRLLNPSAGLTLSLNTEVCDPQHVCQLGHIGGHGGKVLLGLSIHEELHQDGESVDVGVGEDDGAANTGTIIQKIRESWAE